MFETIKYNLFNNWNIVRGIRLAISIFIIVQAIQLHDMLFGLFGCFFLYQALTNTGCCATTGCVPTIHKNDNKDEVEFTEVKNK
jgi:hypothetical protein